MKIRIPSVRPLHLFLSLAGICLHQSCGNPPQPVEAGPPFDPVEAGIAEIHQAFRDGRLTARRLTEIYLARIEKYDRSTGLNAIVVINPQALAEAERLDEEFRRSGRLRPLHGIPVIVKDNYDTEGLQTTAGSKALEGSIPPDDAFQVRRIREAGAIVLAKSNMAEWAFSPYVTESSILGVTRNPYDLERVPAGSSGGTAAAVAANLGAVGLGTDTGNSIRGPSSHNALVGIRSTMGLTSRDGIIPLYLRNDIGGPMARSVEDAVRVLEVIAGPDPNDPVPPRSEGKIPDNYTQFLDKNGLQNARLGLFRRYVDDADTDLAIRELTLAAVADLERLGAAVVDSVDLPGYDALTEDIWCPTFVEDVNRYLATLGDKAPYASIQEIYRAGIYSDYIREALERFLTMEPLPCPDLYTRPENIRIRNAVLALMDSLQLDAIIYPTWSNPPRKVGDMESPAGDNSQILSPHTGFPAITVPMGFSYDQWPAGLTFLGRLFDEPKLIRYTYAYEQATRHRWPPEAFPAIDPRKGNDRTDR